MNAIDLARELLTRASDDRHAANALLSVGDVSDAIVGFHAQQAVEKALKAALAASGEEFPFTHNLSVLTQLCEDAGVDLPESLSDVDLLTPYASQLRYGTTQTSTVDRKRSLELASEAVIWATRVVDDAAATGTSEYDQGDRG